MSFIFPVPDSTALSVQGRFHKIVLSLLTGAFLLPATAQALTVQYSHSGSTPGFSTIVHTLSQFDPALGTLQSARLDYSYSYSSFIDVQTNDVRNLTPIDLSGDNDPFTPGNQVHIGFSYGFLPRLSYLGQTETGVQDGPIAACIVNDIDRSCNAFAEATHSFAGTVGISAGDLSSLVGLGSFTPELLNDLVPTAATRLNPLFGPGGTFIGYQNAIPGDGPPIIGSSAVNIGGFHSGTLTVTYEYAAAVVVPSPRGAALFLIAVVGMGTWRARRVNGPSSTAL